MVVVPSQKLQLLADALALEFSQSQASAECGAAFRRLLPSLEYLGIALSNPFQAGTVVASGSFATEGPTILHLHDLESSFVGLALAQGQPAQVSLLNEDSFKVVPAWTDVQQMVIAAPSVTHVLCVPFGCGSNNGTTSEAASSGSNGTGRCQRHSPCGSGRGALLFGLSEAPNLDGRCATLLAALTLRLSDPMARHSADTLAFVNYACGIVTHCTCCCPHDSGSEEEAEGLDPGGPCRDDWNSNGGDGGPAPGKALCVPHTDSLPIKEVLLAAKQDQAGPSSEWWDDPAEPNCSGKAAAAAAPSMPSSSAAPYQHPTSKSESDTPAFRFSKALVTAVEEDEGITRRQHLLTLTFHSALVEREYGQWVARHHMKVDALFCLLLLTALPILSYIRPHCLTRMAPGTIILGLSLLSPLILTWCSRHLYTGLRERLVMIMRLYVVVLSHLASIRSYQGRESVNRVQQWLAFWMLTGAESLFATALGFMVRMRLHLPVQFAAVATAACNFPQLCAQCYPSTDACICFESSLAMATTFGYLLPTLCLRYIEQRSRHIFANQLRAAAVQDI